MSKNLVTFIVANNLIWDAFPEPLGTLFPEEMVIERIYTLLANHQCDQAINAEIRRILKLCCFHRVYLYTGEYMLHMQFYTTDDYFHNRCLCRECEKKPRGYLIQIEDGEEIHFYSSRGNELYAS